MFPLTLIMLMCADLSPVNIVQTVKWVGPESCDTFIWNFLVWEKEYLGFQPQTFEYGKRLKTNQQN